jgi:uncharacterized protein (TIGR02646 family)
VDTDGIAIVFEDYQEAGPHLKARIGRYCCYCERAILASLAVEHKLPREHHPHLTLAWSNLLLACSNCNSTKGYRDTANTPVIWPDEEDTYSVIEYARSGAVRPADGVPEVLAARVRNLLDLTGLTRCPRDLRGSDHRFFDRQEAWRKAEQSAADLAGRDTLQMRTAIIEVAKSTGGFSIWMKAFANDAKMHTALRAAFPGTAATQRQD